jgi:perosamine synthetase
MIPIYQPYFNEKNLNYAHKAINSGWISSQGEYLDKAKNKLKELFQGKKVILTNNGTSATHLLSIALRYKHPHIDKIIVPNNVYVAAWNSFLYDKHYDLIPIDSDLETWNFDTTKIKNLVDDNTAILVVHNVGNVINVQNLKSEFPNTIILEDNCEGFTGKYNNKYTGTESFASSISFFGNKTITCGEGGAFITGDSDVFEYINSVKSQGQSDEKYIHNVLGYNYRMTNIQAAILLGQLECLDEIKEKKHEIFEDYRSYFRCENNISLQKIQPDTNHSEWMFGLRLNKFTLQQKKDLELHLFQLGIDTRPMFSEINKHKHLSHIINENANSRKLYEQCIILPSHPDLTGSQINFIADVIIKYLSHYNEVDSIS